MKQIPVPCPRSGSPQASQFQAWGLATKKRVPTLCTGPAAAKTSETGWMSAKRNVPAASPVSPGLDCHYGEKHFMLRSLDQRGVWSVNLSPETVLCRLCRTFWLVGDSVGKTLSWKLLRQSCAQCPSLIVEAVGDHRNSTTWTSWPVTSYSVSGTWFVPCCHCHRATLCNIIAVFSFMAFSPVKSKSRFLQPRVSCICFKGKSTTKDRFDEEGHLWLALADWFDGDTCW